MIYVDKYRNDDGHLPEARANRGDFFKKASIIGIGLQAYYFLKREVIPLIALKDNQISVYEGAYHPTQVFKNGEKLAGWKMAGMVGKEGEFWNTYNDAITVYGKTDYRVSRNLCPPPTAKLQNDGTLEWGITLTGQGRFNLFSKTVGPDVVMLMKPNIVQTVTLPAGTYTASSNSQEIRFYFSEFNFAELPHTFTLDSEQSVSFGAYNTDFSQTDVYIQIEKGEAATEYDPYAGDPAEDPSPENVVVPVGAQGEIKCSGKNLIPFPYANGSDERNGVVAYVNSDGTILLNGQKNDSWQFYLIHIGKEITLPEGTYTISGGQPNKGVNLWARYEGNAFRDTSFVLKEPTKIYCYITVENNVVLDNVLIRPMLTKGINTTEYQSYIVPQIANVMELHGLEVDEKAPYNYSETIDGKTHYYISDVLSGGKLTQYIGKMVLDGTENWSTYALGNDSGFCLYNAVPSVASNAVSCLCNAFSGITRDDMYRGGLGVSVGAAKDLRISQCYDEFGRNIAQFKAFLSERYASGNPVIIYYALANPKIETVQNSPITLPRYTKVAYTPKVGYPDLGLAASVKIQES